uniref:RING finger protein 37 n=1 Tax=Lygus hesperus TaxID=30085 RepID=A0A0K8T915_LYGHE
MERGKISLSLPGNGRVLRQEVVVPEEFIDPISCEIMTIPMTLPSGNIVDLSTLEKFYSAEGKMGRGRSDPFTGVLFTDQNKPVAAVSLKARLDKFLLENCDEPSIKVLPRTLGKKPVAPWSSYSLENTNQNTFRGETSSNRTAQSVDQLLTHCLEGLPSYIDEPPPKKLKIGCPKCLDPFSSNSDTYIFKLPCQHTVCRKCLCVMRESRNVSCRECDQPFIFESIERHHV